MLKQIRLQNFRRFEDHIIPFRPSTIIVGPNNAGKSTVVEALRLVSFVTNRYRNLAFHRPPDWLTSGVGSMGVAPSLKDLRTNLQTVFFDYRDPPASIEARFTTGAAIDVYIGPEEMVFAVIRDDTGRAVKSRAQTYELALPRIGIQPQVAPVQHEEVLLGEETVRRGMDSPLAPSHFRNQLLMADVDTFGAFIALAESSWSGLRIMDNQSGLMSCAEHNDPLSFLVRDGGFVGEVSAMGHGLQMWLQIMWFLARNEGSPTIVLDEPDVYMHADLQRRLIRLLRDRHQQVIVATHSVEILAQVEPTDVLVVNGELKKSKWATGIRGVQNVVDNIGGVHNLQLTRLAGSRRCLFVEGKDVAILRRLNDTLFPESDALDVLPSLSVGGWTGWQKVVGAAQFLHTAADDAVTSYALFDSDYHLPDEIAARFAEAEALGIELLIWPRKEIENYLLEPTCVVRVIESLVVSSKKRIPEEEVRLYLAQLAESMRDDIVESLTDEVQQRNRRLQASAARRRARTYVEKRLAAGDSLLMMVPGKVALSRLSQWVQDRCGKGVGVAGLAGALRVEEMAPEVIDLLTAVEERSSISGLWRRTWRDRADLLS